MDTNRISRAAKARGWTKRERGHLIEGINWLRKVSQYSYNASYRILLYQGGLSILRKTPLETILVGAEVADPDQVFAAIHRYFNLD